MSTTHDELEAERRRLAFEASSGDAEAAARLEEVEREISARHLDEERGRLAEEERSRREEEARLDAEEADRRKRRRRLQKLVEEQSQLSGEIDRAVDGLANLVGRHVSLGAEASNLWRGLGGAPFAFDSGRTIKDWLSGRLALGLPSGSLIPAGETRPLADVWNIRTEGLEEG